MTFDGPRLMNCGDHAKARRRKEQQGSHRDTETQREKGARFADVSLEIRKHLMLMRRFLLVIAALLVAGPAAAQQRGFTVDEIVDLLRNQVASERVLFLVQQRCIHFVPDKEAVARVAAAGGSEELVAGLRAPDLCSTLRTVARPRPPVGPDTARTAPGAKPAAGPPYGDAFAAFGYNRNSFRADEGEEEDTGHGIALELGGGSKHLSAVLRADYAGLRTASDLGYTVVQLEAGLRLHLFPPKFVVRPYADAFGSFADVNFDGVGEDDPGYALDGFGRSFGGGVVIGVGGFGVDVSYRTSSLKLNTLTVGDDETKLDDPRRARGGRWVVNLRLSPAQL